MKNGAANSDLHCDAWFGEMVSASNSERVKTAEELLTQVSTDKDGDRYAKSFLDRKEFYKLQFIPYVYYIPTDRTLEDRALLLKFSSSVLAQKHKKLPLIFAMSYEVDGPGTPLPIDHVAEYKNGSESGIKQILPYAKTVSRMSLAEKKKLTELIIEGIESYRKENSPGAKGWFSDYLRSEKDFVLLGFALNLSYLNIDPNFGDTKPLWIHPWGTPALLYKHKRLPFLMITGPSMRLDENIYGEKNMVGFTG